MVEFLAVTGAFNATEVRLDLVSLIPCPLFTILQVLLWCILFTKSKVTQADRCCIILGCRCTKQIIWFVCRVPAPIDDFAGIVHQPCQLDPHDPSSIRQALLAKLVETASFS